MRHLYYCRHGLSEMNEQGLLCGSTDSPLSPKGRSQALAAAKSAMQNGIGFDLIVSSTMLRAYETATIIGNTLGMPLEKILPNPLLVERDFGKLEGTLWYPYMDLSKEPSVESYEHIMHRAAEAKKWLDNLPAQTILLVSHGSFIRAIRSLYTPSKPYGDATETMPNGEIIQII